MRLSTSGLNFILIGLLIGCTKQAPPDPPLTLHLFTEEKVESLDPVHAVDLFSAKQSLQAYEPLFRYHYLKRPYVLEPLLAASVPEVSKDGLKWVIQIKKGIYFQDDPCFQNTRGKGRELTADDVVYSLKRLLDPRVHSQGSVHLEDSLVGIEEWRSTLQTSSLKLSEETFPLEGLRLLGRYTVEIKLKKPLSNLLNALALSFTAIVPFEAVDFYGKDFGQKAVGTGPFRLKELNRDRQIVWDKNPTFRKELYPSEGPKEDQQQGLLEDAKLPLPFVHRIVFQVISDHAQVWQLFSAGKLDIIDSMRNYFPSAVTDQEELEPEYQKKGIQLFKTLLADITHITFNLEDPIIGKNKFLRQAMSSAYDERTFINLFYHGRAVEAQGVLPPSIFGYDPNFRNTFRHFDRDAARVLLEKAKFPLGEGLPPLSYACLNDKAGLQQAQYFESLMREIGVRLKINSYSWTELQEVIHTRGAQMWEQAWLADYPDSANFFQLFLTKNQNIPSLNDSGYSNEEFDRLYEQSLKLPNGNQKMHLLTKMNEILAEDCPWIFKAHRMKYVVAQPWIKNYKMSHFDSSPYRYYRIVKAKK